SALRNWTPLFPAGLLALIRYSSLSTKSRVVPPRQIMKVFALSGLSALVSPTIAPSSTRQNAGSPSQPASVVPSKIVPAPALSAGACCAEAGGAASAHITAARHARLESPFGLMVAMRRSIPAPCPRFPGTPARDRNRLRCRRRLENTRRAPAPDRFGS